MWASRVAGWAVTVMMLPAARERDGDLEVLHGWSLEACSGSICEGASSLLL